MSDHTHLTHPIHENIHPNHAAIGQIPGKRAVKGRCIPMQSAYLEVATSRVDHVVDFERHALSRPHRAQLGEPPILQALLQGAGNGIGGVGRHMMRSIKLQKRSLMYGYELVEHTMDHQRGKFKVRASDAI